MDGDDWVLIIMAVGVVLANFLTWKANESAKVRDEASKAAAALLARETAEVKATTEKVVAKVTEIGAATDGVNTALQTSAKESADTIRRLELIIAGFSVQAAAVPVPLAVVTNGREHDQSADPIAVEVVNLDEAPIPVTTQPPKAKAGETQL